MASHGCVSISDAPQACVLCLDDSQRAGILALEQCIAPAAEPYLDQRAGAVVQR